MIFFPLKETTKKRKGDSFMIIPACRRFSVLFCALASSAHADSPFILGPEFSAGSQPWACIVGDIDAGGGVDLAVANFDVPGYATILTGNGAGGFVTVTQPAIGKAPHGLAAADFNSDGNLDLVVSSISNDPFDIVSVMLGNGNATFSAPVEYEVGGLPHFVKAPDLNNDGHPDIVVPSDHQHMISVLLGGGDGRFAPRVDYSLGFSPMNIIIKDVNGDGFSDVVVAANSFFAAFAILKGVGDGTFLPPEFSGSDGFYFGVAADDFNRDGHTDVALLNSAAARVDVFLADNFGHFGDFVSLPVDSNVGSIASGDLYGDGQIQIVTAGYSGVHLFQAHENGLFQDMGAIPGAYGGADIVIADLNGDSALDIVSPDSSRLVSRVLLNQSLFRGGFD
jgi:hypothetical protein